MNAPFFAQAISFALQMQDVDMFNSQRAEYYYKLYFQTKRRKDLRRKSKSRMMKHAAKEYHFWRSIENYTKSINPFSI